MKPRGFALLVLVVASCSIDYREGEMTEALEDTVPNIRMTGLRHKLATKERLIVEMTAESSESFESVKRISLSGVNFREYGQNGELVAEGKADSVTYFTDTKNAEIMGNVEFVSHRENGGIRSQYLYWDDARRFLSGSPDGQTEIFDEDGSRLAGKGFEADVKRLIMSFLQTVDGNYVASGEDESGETENETETADESAAPADSAAGVSSPAGN